MVVALCQSIITFKLTLWNFNATAPRHSPQSPPQKSYFKAYICCRPLTSNHREKWPLKQQY